MLDLIRRAAVSPLAIIGALWPLVMLAPFVPGLPRPSPSGMTWRQELVLAFIFCLGLGLLLKQARNASSIVFASSRNRLLLLSLPAFVLWSAASTLWAANPYPAIHHTFVWSSYLLFMLLIEQLAARPRLLRVSVTALGLVILIISLSCIIGFLGTPLSLFRNNGLGEPLAIVVPLFVALSLKLRRRRAALFCGATAVAAWLAMLQMFERATFLAGSVGLALLFLIVIIFPRLRPQSAMRAALLLMAFVATAALQSIPSPLAHEDYMSAAPSIVSRLKETSSDDINTRARLLFWATAVEMAREHPITGIGADNYDIAFADARARFSARYPASPLVEVNEGFLAVRAHNEYLQILSELGVVGLALFLSFVAALLWTAWRALRRAESPLVPGAVASMAVFAISSGASSVSFRWMGSGLVFFFAAAIVLRFAGKAVHDSKASALSHAPVLTRRRMAAAFAFSLLMFFAMSAQSLNVMMNGAAQSAVDAVQAESRFRSAIFWNPYDAAARFNYGMWLYYEGRVAEAVPHIRYGVENGINSSTCYLYLASAEAEAGDAASAESTLARAIEVYPRSVLLRVRHSALLAALGKADAARYEYAKALSFNDVVARSWRQLICAGKEAASEAARREPEMNMLPGNLLPNEAVLFIAAEQKRRPPDGCNSNSQAYLMSSR